MTRKSFSYISPKLRVKARSNDFGLFAHEPISTGEILTVWGGQVINRQELLMYSKAMQEHSIQVEEDLYLMSLIDDDPADYVNHNCNPNAGLSGQICLVAMRDIFPGEEVCFDYAMSDGTAYDEFECTCCAPNCRGHVTGKDWEMPDLWERYKGYFSPYLQRRIDMLKKQNCNLD